tara:strand:+ start:4211 stop:4546 length:336 start_codon:yes stop_codon:yes gene_type:complete
MGAGLLRDRVEFQRMSENSVDAYGNTYGGWAFLAYRYADLREQKGKEKISGGVLEDSNLATMRVRSDSLTRTVTAADRVVSRGITWAIKNVIQIDAKDTMLELVLEKGVAA